MPLKAASSYHKQCRNSHSIHSHQCMAQPVRAFCKQRPHSSPRWLWQRPTAASRARLAQQAKAGGSCSGREAGAQSAVLLWAFPSEVTPARGWVLLHIFHPASRATEMPGLQPFLLPPAAAMAPPGAVRAGSLPLLVDGGLLPNHQRSSKSISHCHLGRESTQPTAVSVHLWPLSSLAAICPLQGEGWSPGMLQAA